MADLEKDIVQDLAVGPDLNEEFSRLPGTFFHYAYQHAKAEDACRRAEERLGLINAKAYAKYKEKFPSSKENEAKSHVQRSKAYREAQDEFSATKYNRDIIKAGVEAFRIKKDMLVQLGADRRAEYEGTDLKTKARSASKVVKKSYDKKKGM